MPDLYFMETCLLRNKRLVHCSVLPQERTCKGTTKAFWVSESTVRDRRAEENENVPSLDWKTGKPDLFSQLIWLGQKPEHQGGDRRGWVGGEGTERGCARAWIDTTGRIGKKMRQKVRINQGRFYIWLKKYWIPGWRNNRFASISCWASIHGSNHIWSLNPLKSFFYASETKWEGLSTYCSCYKCFNDGGWEPERTSISHKHKNSPNTTLAAKHKKPR